MTDTRLVERTTELSIVVSNYLNYFMVLILVLYFKPNDCIFGKIFVENLTYIGISSMFFSFMFFLYLYSFIKFFFIFSKKIKFIKFYFLIKFYVKLKKRWIEYTIKR